MRKEFKSLLCLGVGCGSVCVLSVIYTIESVPEMSISSRILLIYDTFLSD